MAVLAKSVSLRVHDSISYLYIYFFFLDFIDKSFVSNSSHASEKNRYSKMVSRSESSFKRRVTQFRCSKSCPRYLDSLRIFKKKKTLKLDFRARGSLSVENSLSRSVCPPPSAFYPRYRIGDRKLTTFPRQRESIVLINNKEARGSTTREIRSRIGWDEFHQFPVSDFE